MNYIYIILVSFIISIVSVPFFTKMAVNMGIIDIPDERKQHGSQVPLLGGLGIISSVAVSLLIFATYNHKLLYYFIANAVIVGAGIYDDRKGLTPYQKLFIQFLASSAVIFLLRIKFVIGFNNLHWINVDVMMIILTYFWIILVTNAVNLIDGVDGLASGISFMAYASLLFAAGRGSVFNTIVCLSMLGGILGFLRYNMPKASVFMGDTGSLFLGFNIAIVSLASFGKTSTLLSVVIPALFVAIPIFDTFSAFFLRVLRKKNPLKADRQHLHYRLLDLSLSPVQTLIVFYSLSIFLSCVAIVFFRKDLLLGLLLTLAVLYLFIAAITLLKYTKLKTAISYFTHHSGEESYWPVKTWLSPVMQIAAVLVTAAWLFFYQVWYDRMETFGPPAYIFYGILLVLSVFYESRSGNVVMFRCFLLYWACFSASYICVYTAPGSIYVFAGAAAVLLFLSNVKPVIIYRIFYPLDLLNFFLIIVAGVYIYADIAGWLQTTILSLMYYIPIKLFLINTNTDSVLAEKLI